MRNRLLLTILTFLILGANTAAAWDTNFQVTAELPQGLTRFLGEFDVIYHLPANLTVIGAVTNYPFAHFSVAITITKITSNSITARVKSYEITNFIIPPMLVTAIFGDGSTNMFLTPPVEVVSVATNVTNGLAELEDIYVIRDWLWVLWAGLALIAAGGIFYLVTRLVALRKQKLEEIANSIDPFEQMTDALKELSKWEVNDENYKEYFVRVSETDRRFVERVLEFNALELSTSEIRSALGKMDVKETIREVVLFILKTCDRVKYAKHKPTTEQVREVLTESKNLYDILAAMYKKPDETENAAYMPPAGDSK